MSAIAAYKPDYTKYYRYRMKEPYFLTPSEMLTLKNAASSLPIQSLMESRLPAALALAYTGYTMKEAYDEKLRQKEEKEKREKEEAEARRRLLEDISAKSREQKLILEDIAEKGIVGMRVRPPKEKPSSEIARVHHIPLPKVDVFTLKAKDYPASTIPIQEFGNYISIMSDDRDPTPLIYQTDEGKILFDLFLPIIHRYTAPDTPTAAEDLDAAANKIAKDIYDIGYSNAIDRAVESQNPAVEFFNPEKLREFVLNPFIYIPRVVSEFMIPVHKSLILKPRKLRMKVPGDYLNENSPLYRKYQDEIMHNVLAAGETSIPKQELADLLFSEMRY